MKLEINPRETTFNVNEIFGATIQGEGKNAGQRVAFLRLAGCNLSCVWCDTPYSWDWSRYDKKEESHKTTIADICIAINPMRVNRIVVTGGEPMLQQRLFPELARWTECKLEIETNGTIEPKPEVIEAVDLFTVSPKLAHAGDPEKLRIKIAAIKKFAELAREGKAIFKFVAKSTDDFAEIDSFIELGGIPAESVWVMPEGASAEEHLANLATLADPIIERGWNITARLHTIIWNLSRGH